MNIWQTYVLNYAPMLPLHLLWRNSILSTPKIMLNNNNKKPRKQRKIKTDFLVYSLKIKTIHSKRPMAVANWLPWVCLLRFFFEKKNHFFIKITIFRSFPYVRYSFLKNENLKCIWNFFLPQVKIVTNSETSDFSYSNSFSCRTKYVVRLYIY